MSTKVKRQTYRCEFRSLEYIGTWRANVIMLEDHKELGGAKGQGTTTSAVKFIDFERGVIVTKNSIYHWDV